MSETYSDIVKEIKGYDSPYEYCRINQCINANSTANPFVDAALHLCERVRKAVGGDPKEWWVEDGNGNQVYIGDRFTDAREQAEEVCALGDCAIVGDSGDVFDARICEKVTPDTREKIINDFVETLAQELNNVSKGYLRDVAEQYVDRAMKLGDDDA